MHKVEMRIKESGEQEEELVVSNLRPFTLKVCDHPQFVRCTAWWRQSRQALRSDSPNSPVVKFCLCVFKSLMLFNDNTINFQDG